MLFPSTKRCRCAHTQFSTHTYLFLYSGQLDPSSQIGLSCFSSSQQRHGRGVVASQSVAACGFPRVCFFFHLSLLLLSAFPTVPLVLCPALFALFFLYIFSVQLPLSLSLALSLFLPLSKLSSDWGTVLYASRLLPLTLSHHDDGLLQHTTQHVGCWAWEAQAFALYNHVRLLLQSLNHAESEHLLPAHSGRVGPSA